MGTEAVRGKLNPVTDDDILGLADYAVRLVRPNRGDSADCRSEAIVAGLTALRSAEAKGIRASRRIIRLCMQTAIYRLLQRPIENTLADAEWDVWEGANPIEDNAQPCIARDFLDTHLDSLPKQQKKTLQKWAAGYSVSEIAKQQNVVYCVAWHRLQSGLKKLGKHL